MAKEESKQSPPQEPKQSATPSQNGQIQIDESLFSPGFKSVAAMAGWDEEALVFASLVVEDTPDREVKHKKRTDLQFKSPLSASFRRKHKTQRRSPMQVPVAVLNLDEEETSKENEKKKVEMKTGVKKEKKKSEGESAGQSSGVSCPNSALSCMDKLREELSCAICLDICYEPSTTPCGHSFCKKCLRSAAEKCGRKCPKCRELIGSGRSCTVNTVLWNTIQLLFPQEVEARKAATQDSKRKESEKDKLLERRHVLNTSNNTRSRSYRASGIPVQSSRRDESARRQSRRGGRITQDEDAALALRLQREEFMVAFRPSENRSFTSARENLRAMASRALSRRIRHHPV